MTRSVLGTTVAALALLAACGGQAAPSSAPVSASAPASSAAAKPSAAPSSSAASASAKPAASSAAASAKPAASASASASAAPTATFAPAVEADTTRAPLTRTTFPAIEGKGLTTDIMEVDQQAHRLYVTDQIVKGIDIWDVSTAMPKYLKTVDTGSAPNGVTVAGNVKKVFTGLSDATIAIIDVDPASPKADTVIAKINTNGKKRADETDYDPNTKKMFVANSDDGIVTVIDGTTNQVVKQFMDVGKSLEQPRYNPVDKMMYLTAPDDNWIVQFDPTKDALVKKWDVGDNCQPHGIAINPGTNQALLNCSVKSHLHVALWDFKAGKVVATEDRGGSGDADIYNAKADRYLSAANTAAGPSIGIYTGAGKFITNVPTVSGAHQVAYDETNKIVYTSDRSPSGGLLSFALPNK